MAKKILLLIFLGTLIFPYAAFADRLGGMENTSLSIYSLGLSIADAVWVVFTIIALVAFVIAGIMFLTAQGEPEKLKTARSAFLWGVAGVIVAILAFTVISIVKNALGA